MKKIYMRAFVAFLFLASLHSPAGAEEAKFISEFDGAKYYKAGKFNIVVLNGSYYRMGRQYGTLLKDEIKKMYDVAVKEEFVKNLSLNIKDLEAISGGIYALFPKNMQEIIRGMADGSGMEIKDINLLDQLELLVALASKGGQCSGIAAWGQYTGGKPLVFGRNFEYPKYFKKFDDFLTICIYNPDDGLNSAAVIGYVGSMTSLHGMNDKGVFYEVNDGTRSGGKIFMDKRLTMCAALFDYIFEYSNLDGFAAALDATRTDFPLIINAADKNKAYSFECATFDTRKRIQIPEGLLVATNHFVDPSWGIPPPYRDSTMSVERMANLITLGEKCKGKFDVLTMMKILDTPIDKGGATLLDVTIFQIIAVPENLEIWLKAPASQDWTKISLSDFFRKK